MTTLFHRRPLSIALLSAALMAAGCQPSVDRPVTTHPAAVAAPLNVGRGLLPTADPVTPLGGLPVAIVGQGDHAVVLGMGYRQAVYAVGTADGRLLDTLPFDNAAVRRPTTVRADPAGGSPENGDEGSPKVDRDRQSTGLYYGLAADGDGTLYAAQGAHDSVAVLRFADGKLTQTGTIKARPGDFPAGLATAAGKLFVVNNGAGGTTPPFAATGGLAVYDAAAGRELGRIAFDNPTHTSDYPLAVAVNRAGTVAYVSSERDGTVRVLSVADPAHVTVSAAVVTGSHPTAVLLNGDESRLFVANSQSDTVSVIDTRTNTVGATILTRPGTSRGPANTTPVGLSLSPDGNTLYVALADLNAVGVVDVPTLQMRGMIPAGRYPTATLPTADGHLLIVSGRGHSAMTPNPGNNPFGKPDPTAYVFNRMVGDVQRAVVPTPAELAVMTADVLRAGHLDGTNDPAANPLAQLGRAAGRITHVIYVIKENRTYDQVLGDDARGNGDASLCLFGRDVTPNQHALADRFVLLDNCYACGDVSGDGWVWSTQGTANAYTSRNMPYHYSHRGRSFDYEGQNNGYITGGFPATDADGKPLATTGPFAGGAPAVPDVAQSAPHLWDAAARAGLSYRNYGFYLSFGEHAATRPGADPDAPASVGPVLVPENYPTVPGLQPPGHDGAGRTDADFRRFDLDYADSDAPQAWFDRTHDANCLYQTRTFGKYAAPSRFAEWDREFKQMLAADPSGTSVPNLMLVRLPHDHTQGLSRRHHTPASEVADNDYAVGQLVDAVSHSAIWPHTAIFVIEDDAQAGPDHVDCHRTTAYAISPYLKRGSVDHRFANTDTLLRTMELLLGTDPLSAFDAAAAPLLDWTATPDNAEPYTAVLPAKQIVAQVTPPRRAAASAGEPLEKLAEASDRMDFVHVDAAPADELNRIVWQSVRGVGSPMPPPRDTLASVPTGPKHDDDDDH